MLLTTHLVNLKNGCKLNDTTVILNIHAILDRTSEMTEGINTDKGA